MSRYIGEGYVDGLQKVRIIPKEGSSLGDRVIDKELVICKYKGCPHSGRNITEDNAMMASCQSYTYLVHTHCERGINDFHGNKCPLCGESAHYEPVKLEDLKTGTENKQRKWWKFPKNCRGR